LDVASACGSSRDSVRPNGARLGDAPGGEFRSSESLERSDAVLFQGTYLGRARGSNRLCNRTLIAERDREVPARSGRGADEESVEHDREGAAGYGDAGVAQCDGQGSGSRHLERRQRRNNARGSDTGCVIAPSAAGARIDRRAGSRMGGLPQTVSGADRTSTKSTDRVQVQRPAGVGSGSWGDSLSIAGVRRGQERGLQPAAVFWRSVLDSRGRRSRLDGAWTLLAHRPPQSDPAGF